MRWTPPFQPGPAPNPVLTVAAAAMLVASLAGQADPPAPTVATPAPLEPVHLADQDVAAWREHLLPADREMRWQEVPWLPTFADGMLAADRQGKPLLLWTMNGHPLACT